MSKEKQSYRHIFKATGLFGGVQVIQILTILIRSKFIAVLLGPVGMGISGLFLSTITMIGNISGLGLSFSAVRDISQAAQTDNITKISRIIKIFYRWMWAGGLIGMIITITFAPYLSQFAFGNRDYTWAFVWLSITLLLNIITSGNIALLQGMHRLQDAAKASAIGSIVGLFTSVPLYYFYGIEGIVPALILASITAFTISHLLSKKIKVEPIPVTYKETIQEGQEMVKLGIIMMISVFLGALVTYIVNAFISHTGGVEDVGLYQAGISITNQYIGLVFGAMSADYFPRLSAISTDNNKVKEMANQQAEIVLLIAAPLLILLLVTAPLVIRILLSPEFFPITTFMRFIALGMLFKAASYAVGYISFAKGDKKVFFIVEGIAGNFMTLALNLTAYYFWGLRGLGMSFLVSYLLYFVAILIVTNQLYSFKLDMNFIKLFIIFFVLCLSTFFATDLLSGLWGNVIGGALFIISAFVSYLELDRRTGIIETIRARLNIVEK